MMESDQSAAPESHQDQAMVPIQTMVAVVDQWYGSFVCSASSPRRNGLAQLCVSPSDPRAIVPF